MKLEIKYYYTITISDKNNVNLTLQNFTSTTVTGKDQGSNVTSETKLVDGGGLSENDKYRRSSL